jgi:RNA-directed DNA polymerase
MKRVLIISFDLIRPGEINTTLSIGTILSYLQNQEGYGSEFDAEHIPINMLDPDFSDSSVHTLGNKLGFEYRRYCDDILIICKPKDAETITKMVTQEVAKYSLTIQSKKADIITFRKNSKAKCRAFNQKALSKMKLSLSSKNEEQFYKNLQYLGFEFNGQNIYIRPGSLSRYFRKMKARVVKTVLMAYSGKSHIPRIKRKQIMDKYSHFGARNFISYALNASKKEYTNSEGKLRQGMDSRSILKQLSSHVAIIEQEINNTSNQRFAYIESENKKKLAAGKSIKRNVLKT